MGWVTTTDAAPTWTAAFHATVSSWREMTARPTLLRNVSAGVTVAFVALPLNIALALACGLPPSAGLITGALVGLVGAMLSGARLQITGPEVALAPICLEIVTRHGVEGLLVATVVAGVVQVACGALRVGRLIQLMPVPVIGGFMAAVGLLVIDAQLPRLLGLPVEVTGLHTIRDPSVFAQVGAAPIVGGLVVAILVFGKRFAPTLPGALLGVVAGAVVVAAFDFAVPTVPAFTPHLPTLGLPGTSHVDVIRVLPEAFALAMLASIDSLLCAVGVDTATRAEKRHDSDQELVAQGICNIFAGCIGGMPVAGAIVRSMAAVDAGASTRLAPLVQSVVLLLIFAFAAPLVGLVPIAALAGVLIVVGARLVNLTALARSWRVSRFEGVVFVGTAVGILATDFVAGVGIGVMMALVELARHQRRLALTMPEPRQDADTDVLVVAVDGPISFASHTGLEALARVKAPTRMVLDLRAVPFMDVTGLETLRNALRQLRDQGVPAVVAGARTSLQSALRDAEILPLLASPLVDDIDKGRAIARALPDTSGPGRLPSPSTSLEPVPAE